MTHSPDPYNLQRFVNAQRGESIGASYAQALSEIRRGKKLSDWIWYIFPIFLGVRDSSTSKTYAIRSLAEAEAYLQHPDLGPRLLECTDAALRIEEKQAVDMFGHGDAGKVKSCATLFALVSPPGSVFEQLLAKYFEGEPSRQTLKLIKATQETK